MKLIPGQITWTTVLLGIFIGLHQPITVNGLFEELASGLEFIIHTIEGISETWEIVESTKLVEHGNQGPNFPLAKLKQKELMSRLVEVYRQIENIEHETINAATWTVESINHYVVNSLSLELKLNELADLISRISAEELNMRDYAENYAKLEDSTIQNYIQWIISPHSNAVQGLLDRINNIVAGSSDLESLGKKSLLVQMATYLDEVKEHVCTSRRSAQQVLYHLYTAISLTELKGYAMMQFSWMLLKTFGKGNYTKEADLMRSRFEMRTNKTQHLLKRVVERASNAMWRCDPDKHIEGDTYERLTRLLQGYIENEVDLNNEETCRETCGHYQYTESFGCFKELYCAKQPKCTGKLLYCQYLDSDMWICPSKPRSDRRYEYIEYENGRVLGQKDTCRRGTTKVDSWWRYLFWHCSYCFCICDEQGYASDRYFNLREYLSSTSENKVVTGLRFRKVNRVMHLQIQQGVLLPNGVINASTVSWRPVSDYKLLDKGVRDGIDYHTMAWNKRAIDLDDVIGPPETVVTGVKFRVIGSHLHLEVRLTHFNFETGRLSDPQTTSIWKSSDFTEASSGDNRRTEIKFKDPGIPTKSFTKSEMNSKSNQFLEFTHTGLDADAAQTTIPYIDAQETVPIPPVPLVGVGLYHKTTKQSGGFIGPKIFTYDISPHIEKPTPNPNRS